MSAPDASLLPSLRARFPKAKFSYEPAKDCKRCNGTGINAPRKLPSGGMLNEGPCACLFLGENTGWLLPLIAASAKNALQEMRGEK